MARLVKRGGSAPEFEVLPDVLRAAHAADAIKAADIIAYDLRGLTLIADSFVVCSVTSEPQLKAVTNAVRTALKEVGRSPLQTEGDPTGGWLVLDYGAFIVHVFRKEAREFYDLDGLWGDAPRIPLDLDPS